MFLAWVVVARDFYRGRQRQVWPQNGGTRARTNDWAGVGHYKYMLLELVGEFSCSDSSFFVVHVLNELAQAALAKLGRDGVSSRLRLVCLLRG